MAEEQQGGGDERPRVPDPDPPDEVDDGHGPHDWTVVAEDPGADGDEVHDRDEVEREERPADREADPPPERRALRADQDRRVDDVVDAARGLARAHDPIRLDDPAGRADRHQPILASPRASCGLLTCAR